MWKNLIEYTKLQIYISSLSLRIFIPIPPTVLSSHNYVSQKKESSQLRNYQDLMSFYFR